MWAPGGGADGQAADTISQDALKAEPVRITWKEDLTRETCGILVPGPGIKPTPPEMEVQCLNHWTASNHPIGDSSLDSLTMNNIVGSFRKMMESED